MRPTRRLTTAQALIEFLAGQRIERDGLIAPFFGPVLGIFGHGNVGGVGEALEACQDRVRFIPVRNEQAMVHAAAAYAWKNRRLRALACTSSVGPGATNMVTGAAGATINRLPVLLLPGDVFARRNARPLLQQLEARVSQGQSVNDALRPVSGYWDRIERPEQLLTALPEAMRVLTSPAETGAVTIALPQDAQVEAFDFPAEFLAPRTWHVSRTEPEPGLVDQVAALLGAAKRPLIVAGGGIRYSEAESELADFATAFAIPVASTQAGKASLRWDHPMNLGPIGATGGLAANRYAHDADLVLAIGTRLGDFTTASSTAWQNPHVSFVGINVDGADAAKGNGISLVADARQALRALHQALAVVADAAVNAERMGIIAELRDEWNAEVDRLIAVQPPEGSPPAQAQVIAAVNAAVGSDATMINAAGSMPGDLHKLWRSHSSDDYNVEYGYSCMGYEIAGGLGVKLADPAREVYVLVGDGSYLMMNSEIVTSIQEGLRLTIVVVDSHGYRSIGSLAASMGARNNFQQLRHRDAISGRLEGPVLTIDFAAHAASMGAVASKVSTFDDLGAALATARAADRTTVIVTEVSPEPGVPSYGWWDVPVAEVSKSETVRTARAEYEKARQTERWRA
jgi:3D-(3,5/4)-trihydroxycyclohexane-1,2-dione acylhydrolase (decyclizing)